VSEQFPGFLRVEVTTDGRVLVEEEQMTVEQFSALLDTVAAPHAILYHRSDPAEDPPPIAKDVLDVIIAHRLPVRLEPADFNAPGYVPPPLPS
jgi:hypothetical protein